MRQLKAAAVRVLLSCFCSLILLSAAYARAAPPDQKPFDIDPQALAAALSDFARQSGREILYTPEVVADRRSNELRGLHEPIAGLKVLLKDSGLEFTTTPSGAILIGPPVSGSPASSTSPSATSAPNTTSDETATSKDERSFWDRFRLAQAPAGNAAVNASQSSADTGPRATQIEEIIVTAQKREERLQDVPVPVSVIPGVSLVNSHQLRLEDYFAKVPGLSLALLGPEAAPTLAIRGLTLSGSTNPTVGIVVDDIPYGSTVTIGNALTMASIDPSDIERIEVLRGPQGTLYGASSLGGLLKYSTVDPSTDDASGRIQAGTTSIHNGDDPGYFVRGSFNLPFGETFAIRASAFSTRDPGYIDNVGTGQADVNETDSDGGRLAMLWRPSEDFSLKLGAIVQDSTRQGALDVHRIPGLGDLEQSAIPNTGIYDRSSRVYGATAKARLGGSELTSVTGYSIDETHRVRDDTTTAFAARSSTLFGVAGAVNVLDRQVSKLSQEIRLTIPGQTFEWLLGGFYTRERVDVSVDFRGANPATGADAGSMIDIDTPENRFEEYAAFADLTVHFTERFDVQFGGRASQNEQSFFTVRTGPLVPIFFPGSTSPAVLPTVRTKDSPFTYLITPRLKVSRDFMVYARLASGYRPGSPNINCGLPGVPCGVDADTTENYEVGAKGTLFDRFLSYDVSVYSIDWKDIQLDVNQGGFGFIDNAGSARSRGVELTIDSRPLAGLDLSAWVAWNDAELAEDLPPGPAFGREGDRLPSSSKWSGSFTLDREFSLSARMRASIGGTVSYVGERESIFRGLSAGVPLKRQVFPAYTQVDVRAALDYDTWTFSTFVNNLTDKRALLGGGAGAFIPTAFNYSQPRTVGVSVSKTF